MPCTLWHRDLFDREAAASREAVGVRLVGGLRALWRATLGEGLTADGQRSPSDFSLTWGRGRAGETAAIDTFATAALVRLRAWVADDPGLLDAVVRAHRRLIAQHRPLVDALSGIEESRALLAAIAAASTPPELRRLLAATRVPVP